MSELPDMISAVVQDNNVEKAIRRLKKMLQKEGMFQELRDRRYYVKPSEKKRVAKKAAIRRRQRGRRSTIITGPLGIQEDEQEALDNCDSLCHDIALLHLETPSTYKIIFEPS